MSSGEEIEQDFFDFEEESSHHEDVTRQADDTNKSESQSVYESKRTSLSESSDCADEAPINNELLQKAKEFRGPG